jgi:hypothetical protein
MLDDIKLRSLTRTCIACPSQWDAETWDGEQVYARYRYGYLSVRMGGPGGEEIFGKEVGDGLDGTMSDEDMLAHTGMAVYDEPPGAGADPYGRPDPRTHPEYWTE